MAKAHLQFIEEFQAYPVALGEGHRLLTEPGAARQPYRERQFRMNARASSSVIA